MNASRAAYTLMRGPVASDLFVCHHCDNKRCVRPDHLFLGTRADNAADAIAKGQRSRRGKLTEPQRVDIKRRRLAGESLRMLAREFGVSRTAILKLARRAWTVLE